MIAITSLEAERLQKLIDDKKKYLSKLTNKTASQFLQAEILLLERDILPAVEVGTQILNHEAAKFFNKALDVALRFDCDGFLTYIPLKTVYSESPKIGIFNPKDDADKPGDIYVSIINMDIDGKAVTPINLPLNALLL